MSVRAAPAYWTALAGGPVLDRCPEESHGPLLGSLVAAALSEGPNGERSFRAVLDKVLYAWGAAAHPELLARHWSNQPVHKDILELLLGYGGDPRAPSGEPGLNVIQYALLHRVSLPAFVWKSVQATETMPTDGCTVLHCLFDGLRRAPPGIRSAAWKTARSVLALLEPRGLPWRTEDERGRTPLDAWEEALGGEPLERVASARWRAVFERARAEQSAALMDTALPAPVNARRAPRI